MQNTKTNSTEALISELQALRDKRILSEDDLLVQRAEAEHLTDVFESVAVPGKHNGLVLKDKHP